MLSNRYCALINCVSESCTKCGASFLVNLVLSDWADWSNRTEHREWDMPVLLASATSWWHATRDGQLKGRGCVITLGPSVLDPKARPVVCSLRLRRKYHFKHFKAQGYHKNIRHFPVIYIQSNEIHNVVALIKFLLVLRCQSYMFRTVTVHPQELLVDTVCADYGMW